MTRGYPRRLLRLENVQVADGAGGMVEEWQVRGAVWGNVMARSGGLRAGEFGRTPRLAVRIRIPGLPDGHPIRPTVGQRLRDGTRLYDVEAVHEADPLGRELTILASVVPSEEAA